jgi:hypothetical protein
MVRRLRDGGDEILRRRVAVGVFCQIGMNALLPLLGADISLEHCQHRAALGIGDLVEGVLDIVGIVDRIVDLARRRKLVEAHHIETGLFGGAAPFLIRANHSGNLGLHPRREGFVEPDVVPPGRRHIVAEPLVRQLVRLHVKADALLIHRRIVVHQQQFFAERDRAGVLHRASREVRHRQDVDFLERIAMLW